MLELDRQDDARPQDLHGGEKHAMPCASVAPLARVSKKKQKKEGIG